MQEQRQLGGKHLAASSPTGHPLSLKQFWGNECSSDPLRLVGVITLLLAVPLMGIRF